MGRQLLGAFARTDPERFALLLSDVEALEDALGALEAVPAGAESDVVARLVPEQAERILGAVDDARIAAWLEAGSLDAGRRVLNLLDDGRAGRVLGVIRDRRRRRDLRRLSAYAEGTVGALTRTGLVLADADETGEQILARIPGAGSASGGLVAVVRPEGGVLGVIDPLQLVQNRDSGLTAEALCIPIEPLSALAQVGSLRLPAQWSRLTGLPVVDASGRPVGWVSRGALERALGGRGEGRLFLGAVIELARQYWAFIVHVMVWILDRRTAR